MPSPSPGKRPVLAVLIFVGWCLFALSGAAGAQEKPADEASAGPSTPAPAPIPVSDIPRRAESAIAMLRDIDRRAAPQASADAVAEQLDSAREEIQRLADAPELRDPSNLSLRGLQDQENRWQTIGRRLDGWQSTVSSRTQYFQTQTQLIRDQRVEWQLTLDTSREQQIPEVAIQRVRDVLKSFDETDKALRERRDWLLTQGSKISELKVQVDSLISLLDRVGDELYRIAREPETRAPIDRVLVSDWHLRSADIPTIVKPGMLGEGYVPHLAWADKELAGSEVDIVVMFEDDDGNVARAGTKSLRIPKYGR